MGENLFYCIGCHDECQYIQESLRIPLPIPLLLNPILEYHCPCPESNVTDQYIREMGVCLYALN
jgi:hypothetical protein